MSLARRHIDRVSAAATPAEPVPAAPSPAAGAEPVPPAHGAAAAIGLRLTHDLRRLKEIRSIDAKIAAKREMLPEYAAWVEGLIAADAGAGSGIAGEILPTIMVWRIDVGDYAAALDLLPFLLKHGVPMPARYNRDAATVAVEEIATAALKAQAAGQRFELDHLLRAADLTAGLDLHDEPRAKLMKAIGSELLADAEEAAADDAAGLLEAAIATLAEAHRLNDRIGVKDRLKRAHKLLAAVTPEPETGAEESPAKDA